MQGDPETSDPPNKLSSWELWCPLLSLSEPSRDTTTPSTVLIHNSYGSVFVVLGKDLLDGLISFRVHAILFLPVHGEVQ
jgi:hypothetical protein